MDPIFIVCVKLQQLGKKRKIQFVKIIFLLTSETLNFKPLKNSPQKEKNLLNFEFLFQFFYSLHNFPEFRYLLEKLGFFYSKFLIKITPIQTSIKKNYKKITKKSSRFIFCIFCGFFRNFIIHLKISFKIYSHSYIKPKKKSKKNPQCFSSVYSVAFLEFF